GRPHQARGQPRRRGRPHDPQGVRPAPAACVEPGPGLHARRARRVGVGLRVERRHRDGDGAHPPAAGEDRGRPLAATPARDRARRRLPVRRMSEMVRLVALLGPIALATLVTSLVARRLATRLGLAYTLIAIAVIASLVTVVDLLV